MIKKMILIIVVLILSVTLFGCKEKEKLYSLKENYEEITTTIQKQCKGKFPNSNPSFKLVDVNNLSESEYENFCYEYGEGWISSINAKYTQNASFGWLILEYENEDCVRKAFYNFDKSNLYLYKKFIFTEFPGRMDIIYNVITDDGCKYVDNYKTIVGSEKSVKKIELIDLVERIESYGFLDNVYLEEIVSNDINSYIGSWAFGGTLILKKFILSENLKYIGSCAFYNSGLKKIVIPESVEFIGSEAFNKCNVFCEAESKPSGWADDFITGDAKVYYKGEWEYNEEGIPVPLV